MQNIDPTRRNLLRTTSLLAATMAFGGCTTRLSAAKPRVVIVGGGWGGLGATRRLAESGQVSLTLIEPNARFMSCPSSIGYIVGHHSADRLARGYERIDALGVQRVQSRVIGIDRAGKTVETANREKFAYDFLVLSPGIEYIEEGIPGFAEHRDRLPIGFRMHEQSAVKAEVERYLSEGGVFLITVPKPPYRCPPAPYERAMMIAEQIQRRRVNGKVIIVDANPNPIPGPIAKPILDSIAKLYPREIERISNTEITRIDAGQRRVETRAGAIKYTGVNIVPPMRAASLIRQAGLGQRWADVLMPSFRARADESIYVIGDAHGSPLPKSGHVAFGSGQQVANDILATIAGKPMPSAQDEVATLPSGICWAEASSTEAIMVLVSASQKRGEAPQLRFQVDPIANASSSKGSKEWAERMWQSMLG
ncbi:MAG: FAD-dependent oxidoreductase [Casimicrobiaceae bacterium]